MDRIAHFGDFREHYRCAATYKQIRRVADRWVCCHAGERIAAAALRADNQLRSRAGFALTLVQPFQMDRGNLQNVVHHRSKANVMLILQTHNACAVYGDCLHIVGAL
ncbi:hypothetical protein D3C80_1711920 [compost metagenome]